MLIQDLYTLKYSCKQSGLDVCVDTEFQVSLINLCFATKKHAIKENLSTYSDQLNYALFALRQEF